MFKRNYSVRRKIGETVRKRWKEGRMKPSYGNLGKKHSKEAKRRISIANKGRLLSEEHKRKIALSSKGRIVSDEARTKIRNSNLGKKRTIEQKERLSKSLLGRKIPKETRRVMSLSKGGNGILFPSINEKQNFERKSLKEKLAGRPKPSQCEVCGAIASEMKKGLFFDHDHKTGKFRGWICRRCNFVLGLVKDMPELLEKLASYIRNNT